MVRSITDWVVISSYYDPLVRSRRLPAEGCMDQVEIVRLIGTLVMAYLVWCLFDQPTSKPDEHNRRPR